ncbi:unnamed protein product [Mytilus coruscus]|uniref:Integrase catalytic domain-containing protein n=1 Tax=Mytilus coruscus TaxID=42192 RepID=A0A6J8EPN2_MYTCO|nr:unnamed protein product [Mytilus coruscus]
MPHIIQIAKAKEEHQNWGAKKIVDELKVPFSDRMVKQFLSLYSYDQESKCIYKKSQDLNSNHKECLYKEKLIDMISKNHTKDHRKYGAIYDCLRSTIFPVVRENINILFKLNVNCQCCNNAVEIPKTTVLSRPIPATYANSRWKIDLKKMPPVKGYNYICNIVDCYYRLAFSCPLKGKLAKDVAELILKYVYLYGSPRISQSDNGKEFTNANLAEKRDVVGKRLASKLSELYYKYNRVHKSTKPSTPYQLYFKRRNCGPPIDEQLPFERLTEDERKFLEQAHLDVETEEEDIDEIVPESDLNENENGNF